MLLFAALAAGGASARPESPILTRAGYLHLFAADGNRIALPSNTGPPRWCLGTEVVDIRNGKPIEVPSPGMICEEDWSGTEPWELALASDRVGWIDHGMTNNSSALVLSTARIGTGASRRVVSGDGPTFSGDEIETPDHRVGLLAGDGATLAFATWTIAPGGKLVRDERLWRIGTTGRESCHWVACRGWQRIAVELRDGRRSSARRPRDDP